MNKLMSMLSGSPEYAYCSCKVQMIYCATNTACGIDQRGEYVKDVDCEFINVTCRGPIALNCNC